MTVSDPDTTRSNPQGTGTTGATQAGPFDDLADNPSVTPTGPSPGQRAKAASQQERSQQERGPQGGGIPSADRLLDELLPEQVEWETLVRRYPKPALLAAAGLGFYVALQRGPILLAAFSGFAAQEMTRRVNDFLGSDVI